MRKLVYTSVASILIAILMTINVFAMPYNPGDFTSVNEVSELLAPGVKESHAVESSITRGDFFLRADLIIKDNGNGKIGALAVGYTNVPVDEAYITLYLDRWNAEEGRWNQVNFYEAEFYSKDYPDGLITPTVDISFINNPKGYYYRLRGVFGVMLNNEFEGFSPVTDGILIE